jgi:hypothetical protein
MSYVDPSPEELLEWATNAQRRNAILPYRFQIQGRYTTINCGNSNCNEVFTRKILPGRNDPVYVCPGCNLRIYLPVEW